MYSANTITQAILFDTTLAEVLGPYGLVGFLAIVGALFGVALAVLVRGIVEQVRGPKATRLPSAHEEAPPAPMSAT